MWLYANRGKKLPFSPYTVQRGEKRAIVSFVSLAGVATSPARLRWPLWALEARRTPVPRRLGGFVPMYIRVCVLSEGGEVAAASLLWNNVPPVLSPLRRCFSGAGGERVRACLAGSGVLVPTGCTGGADGCVSARVAAMAFVAWPLASACPEAAGLERLQRKMVAASSSGKSGLEQVGDVSPPMWHSGFDSGVCAGWLLRFPTQLGCYRACFILVAARSASVSAPASFRQCGSLGAAAGLVAVLRVLVGSFCNLFVFQGSFCTFFRTAVLREVSSVRSRVCVGCFLGVLS